MSQLYGPCGQSDPWVPGDFHCASIRLVEFSEDLTDKNTGLLETRLQNAYNRCCVGTDYNISVMPARCLVGLYEIVPDGAVPLTIDSPHYETAMAIGQASRRLLSAQKAYDEEQESILWMLDCTLKGIKRSKDRKIEKLIEKSKDR